MNKLKEIRKSKNLSQKQVAEYIGINQNTYSYWENGRNRIDDQSLKRLAIYFNVSVDDILGNETPAPKQKGIKIPVLGRVAAGLPIEAVEEVLDWEEITPDMAKYGEYFALSIHGDSMEPDMREGDVLVVRKQSDAESGQIVIAYVNGYDATCKKLVKRDDGIMLIPLNQKYDPMFYSNVDVGSMPVVILGRVLEVRKKY